MKVKEAEERNGFLRLSEVYDYCRSKPDQFHGANQTLLQSCTVYHEGSDDAEERERERFPLIQSPPFFRMSEVYDMVSIRSYPHPTSSRGEPHPP